MSSKTKKKQEVHPMMNRKANLTDLFASDIATTARLTGHQPWELPWNVYLKNSQHKSKSHGLLQQFIASNLWSTIKASYFPVPKDEVASVELKTYRQGRDALKKEVATGEFMLREFERIADAVKPEPIKFYKPAKRTETERYVIVNLSDWHIGANLNPEESGYKFGPVEEARAVARLAKTIINYKLDHRKNTRLILVGLGDWIENFLHGSSQASYVPIQLARTQDLLRQLIIQLIGGGFISIDFYGCTGNHDRDITIHQKRAVRQRWASWATLVYLNLKAMFENESSNVKFHLSKKPYIEFELFGVRYYGNHGDNFLTAPNPGKNLDTRNILHQAMKINNKEAQQGKAPFKVFMVGHVHTPGVLFLDEGCRLVINGPLLPPDMYAQSLGIQTAVRGHIMFEATPGFPIGDCRLITLDGSESDSKLDTIVKASKILQEWV